VILQSWRGLWTVAQAMIKKIIFMVTCVVSTSGPPL